MLNQKEPLSNLPNKGWGAMLAPFTNIAPLFIAPVCYLELVFPPTISARNAQRPEYNANDVS